MPIYKVGKTIKELRKRKNVSQEELCEGLCEPPTLSKIECGRQNPTKKLFEALMSRLGASSFAFNIPVTETEFARGQLEREIASSFSNFNYRVDELLCEYKECSPNMDKLEKQFYLFASAVSASKLKNESEDFVLDMLIESLRLSLPKYEMNMDFSMRLLSVFELVILNNIAILLLKVNRKDEGINLLLKLEDYFCTHEIEREEYAKQYPIIVDNLVSSLAEVKEYGKAFEFAKKGFDCCIKYGKLSPLPFLAYNLGFLHVCLNYVDIGANYINQAISLLKLMNRENDIEKIREDLTSSFDKDFLEKISL